ncbi:hypothetical protein OG440_41180 (plasmid) [Streptomyces sp. NBC_00637]|uniref:hypothetical protein n=1 Tax=Streptomyces sp. NBC_00637 TaxID=2903667 RepID=UPI0032543CA1
MTVDAVSALGMHRSDVTRDGGGPQLARRLHALNTAEQPTWARPLFGGEGQWRRIAREVTADRGWFRT